MLLSLLLSAFLTVPAAAESLEITNFRGLNNSADSTVIGDGQAQDLLNVEANKGGTGIRKRAGYATSLTVSTAAPSVTSIATIKNNSGSECTIAVASGTVYQSTNQGNPVQITTITTGARLFCSTNNGKAYCFPSSGSGTDKPFSYDCQTFTYMDTKNFPAGKFSAFMPDRQVVSGTTSSLNSLYFSKSGDFEDHRTGTDIGDAWVEDVGTAGDRVTGAFFLNGRIIAYKEYAIVGFNCTDQFNCPSYTISNTVGIANPEAVVEVNGKHYFKGSDNEFYVTDGAPGGLENISLTISSTTASLLTGKSRYSLFAAKANWDTGNLTASGAGAPIRSDIVVGSIMPSSTTIVDTTGFDFSTGPVFSSLLTTASIRDSVSISSREFVIPNGDFETGAIAPWSCVTESGGCNCDTSGLVIQGSYSGRLLASCSGGGATTEIMLINALTHSTLTVLQSDSLSDLAVETFNITDYSTQPLKIRFHVTNAGNTCFMTSSTFTAISSITVRMDMKSCSGGTVGYNGIDGIRVNNMFATQNQSSETASYISRWFDMGVSTPIGGTLTGSSTTPAGTSLAYQVRSATAPTGIPTAWTTITNETRITEARRYYQYLSSFTTSVGTSTPRLNDVTLVAATSGSYITSCIQPGGTDIAWGTIEVSGFRTGLSSFTFQNSTGSNCNNVGSYFSNVTTGAAITIATAPAYQVKIIFHETSGTETARVDSLRVNWTEGAVAPPTYGTFWNDDIYWAVANAGTTNNRVIKLDLLYNEWYLFDIAANALSTFNNSMYFGCVSCGKIYKYSDINYSRAPSSDDGSSINAYYKTKDYSGADRYVENQYDKISLIAKDQASGSMTVAWALNGGQTGSGSYTVQLSTGDNAVRSNYQFPAGRRGTFSNLQFSNNSTSPFEVLGVRLEFTPQPWRPLP